MSIDWVHKTSKKVSIDIGNKNNEADNRIKKIKDGTGTGFVIVEHNLKSLLPLADHAYILDQGRVIYDGKAESDTLDKMMSSIFEAK